MRTPIGVAVALAIALAGCGGGAGDQGGLTRAQLAAKVSLICRHGTARVEQLGTPDFSDPVTAATYLQAVVRAADAEIAQSRALHPAAGLKPVYDAWIARVVDERDFLKGVLAKARAKDRTGLEDLQNEARTQKLAEAEDAAARKAGLTGCVKRAAPSDA